MNLSGSLILKSPASRMFLRASGIEVNPFTQLEAFKQACEQANPRYKGGRDLVRFQLEEDESNWPEEVTDATLNLAGFLGMCRGETPLTGEYDVIIALGGARRAPLHRACYAAQAIEDVRATADMIIVAGSIRQLAATEKPQDYAVGADTEYDLCVGAASWIQKRYPKLNISTVCKNDPRSGNDGVIDKVMQVLGASTPLSVAAVTTKIYAVGLHLDMARAARRHGWRGFLAAGHGSDPEMVSKRGLIPYYSECLTTLRKAAIAAAEGC